MGGSTLSLLLLSELCEGGGRGERKEEGCKLCILPMREEGKGGRKGREEERAGKGSKGGRSPTLLILQQLIHSDIPHLL